MEKHCKDCVYLESSKTFSWCNQKDLYTETDPNDDICEDFTETKTSKK